MRWFRRIHAAVTVATVSLITILSLSDTVSDPLRTIPGLLGHVREQAGRGPNLEFGWINAAIATDKVSHFLAWCFAGTLAVGLARTKAEYLSLYLSLFACSALVELGQRHLSMTRQAEVGDLMANGAGLIVGFATGWLLFSSIGVMLENRYVRLIPRMVRPT